MYQQTNYEDYCFVSQGYGKCSECKKLQANVPQEENVIIRKSEASAVITCFIKIPITGEIYKLFI